jgi:photosynthetic reaction center cytochrome c subunit
MTTTRLVLLFLTAAFVLLNVAMLFTAGWVHPPIHGAQGGYRGLAMLQLSTNESERLLKLANKLPDPIDKASPDGDKATSVYKNVKVLTDLSVDQFNRVMLGMAAWVAPADQSCAYCHNTNNMADDSLYTKRVARVMLNMTRHINKEWQAHVGTVGVTCYTCHRGMPVPANIWFKGAPRDAGGMATNNEGLGHPNNFNGSTGLGIDPFSGYLNGDTSIRVEATQALPVGYGAPIQSTEKTYGLMMSISKSLGVNCTYCHNTRAFSQWPQSTPQRVTAWHGLAMVRELNAHYLGALQPEWPPNRLGPTGDGPKLFCATCHQGAPKPLLGVSLAKDWPELGGVAAP